MAISVWTVKAGILTALENGLLNGSTVYADVVQLGIPTQEPSPQQQRRVYILDVPPFEARPVWANASTPPRQEDYVVPVAVEVESVLGPKGTYQTAMNNLSALVAQIEDIQNADPSWGGVCFTSGLSLAGESCGQMADEVAAFLAKAILQIHIRTIGN